MNVYHSVLCPADVIIATSGASFCKEPCKKSTFLSCQVKREQADMYWKCTGNIMIANCFEKKKVLWRTCHFNPCLWGSASAPSFVSLLRYMPSLTLDFGESSTCAVDQKQHLNYKEEERAWTLTAPPPQKGAALFLPSFVTLLRAHWKNSFLLAPPDEFLWLGHSCWCLFPCSAPSRLCHEAFVTTMVLLTWWQNIF